MDAKGQFVTLFFLLLVVLAVLELFNFEYANLVTNANINAIQTASSAALGTSQNLLKQYTALKGSGATGGASAFFSDVVGIFGSTYFPQYNFSSTSAIVISGDTYSISYQLP
jgi:hypothetical protein